jgi:hypothetical protein
MFKAKVDFLESTAGEIVWPHEWQVKCKAPPECYFIVEREAAHSIRDALRDDRYFGTTQAYVFNVPSRVTEADLRAWLNAGVGGSDEKVWVLHCVALAV